MGRGNGIGKGITYCMLVCGVGMIVALVLWISHDMLASVLYTVSAFGYIFMQSRQVYEGHNIVVRRLSHLQMLGGVVLILAGLLMCVQAFHVSVYFHHNEWMVALAVGCVLQLYTAFRLPAEIDKEKK